MNTFKVYLKNGDSKEFEASYYEKTQTEYIFYAGRRTYRFPINKVVSVSYV